MRAGSVQPGLPCYFGWSSAALFSGAGTSNDSSRTITRPLGGMVGRMVTLGTPDDARTPLAMERDSGLFTFTQWAFNCSASDLFCMLISGVGEAAHGRGSRPSHHFFS